VRVIGYFRVPSQKFQGERPTKSDFRLGKSDGSHNPRLRNPRWLLRASTVVKCIFFFSTSVCLCLIKSVVQTNVQILSATVCMRKMLRNTVVINWYCSQWLTWLEQTQAQTNVFLEAPVLVFRFVVTGTRSTRV